jgi:cytochrome c peroxidase
MKSCARITRAMLPALALGLSGCGGGGHGSTSPAPGKTPPPNRAPQAIERQDVLVKIGQDFAVDATLGGARFGDPDGDPLGYVVTVRGPPGVAVDGLQIRGKFEAAGAVEVTVTATDPRGARAQSRFVIAAPAAPPGAPTLPAATLIYADESLPLPDAYRKSSQGSAPLWDAQPDDNRTTDAGATLGRVLFHDRRLSITNTLSCASCHQQRHGFASPQRFNTGVIGAPLTRNAMALANARYNVHRSWFSDLRVVSIRDAAREALTRPDEMGNTLAAIETKLRDAPFYTPLFTAAFGSPGITGDRVLRALQQYVQALISYRTRFDRQCAARDGFEPVCELALTPEENRGRELFFASDAGHVPCAKCHVLPGGANDWMANNGLDASVHDVGAGNGRFRAASLHNIALTAPYMHDGRFATLREVIDHYDHGILDSPDLDSLLRGPDGKPLRMNLPETDKRALEAFLRTLSDNAMIADPRFSDPFK